LWDDALQSYGIVFESCDAFALDGASNKERGTTEAVSTSWPYLFDKATPYGLQSHGLYLHPLLYCVHVLTAGILVLKGKGCVAVLARAIDSPMDEGSIREGTPKADLPIGDFVL
jgi:hypothetical protein